MKRALISTIEIGRVCDVVSIGNEFETTTEFYWVDCPNDTTSHHTYDDISGTFIPFNIVETPGFKENAWLVARQIGYKSSGEQLDMI